MRKTKAVHKKPIVIQSKLNILVQLYRFRFGTADVVARSIGLKDGRYVYTRLETLVRDGYIGKKYDTSYKQLGKPASYYLLSKSFVPLRQRYTSIGAKALRNAAKDKTASGRFTTHCVDVFMVYDKLLTLYGERLIEYYSKSQLNDNSVHYLPKPLPDAFITIRNGERQNTHSKHFFLEVIDENTAFFVTIRRLKYYVEYTDSEVWPNRRMPTILVVCDTKLLQRKVLQQLRRQPIPVFKELKFYTITKETLLRWEHPDEEMWLKVDSSDDSAELFSLS